jgi:hypothetical protein
MPADKRSAKGAIELFCTKSWFNKVVQHHLFARKRGKPSMSYNLHLFYEKNIAKNKTYHSI